jgi:RNAse (barnase) inhibitor barstar
MKVASSFRGRINSCSQGLNEYFLIEFDRMNACVVNAILIGLPIDFRYKAVETSKEFAQIKSFEQLFNMITNNDK